MKSIHKNPIFIIGHWRSGTTHLHNILSQDPQMAYTTTYQSVFPDTLFNKLGRFLFVGFSNLLIPVTRKGDNVILGMSLPQEEEFALGAKTPICFYYFWMFPKNIIAYYNNYIRFNKIKKEQLKLWKSDYELLIKKAIKNTNREVFLSKNPPNTGRIKILLEMFPNAKFIHIHRNPIEVFLSTQNFYKKMLPHLQLQNVDQEEMDKNILKIYKELMKDYFEQKKFISSGNLIEVSFEQLENNTMSVLANIYKKMNMKGFERAQPKFHEYLESMRDYKKNKHIIKKKVLKKLLIECDFTLKKLNYKIPKNLEIKDD
ncbi:MAG: sulfotransferase [Flavobacteriaceae bacterium]|nr:sulfotransferase [Flavobacteriaceae bacterium]